jgi:hypothetical protein
LFVLKLFGREFLIFSLALLNFALCICLHAFSQERASSLDAAFKMIVGSAAAGV